MEENIPQEKPVKTVKETKTKASAAKTIEAVKAEKAEKIEKTERAEKAVRPQNLQRATPRMNYAAAQQPARQPNGAKPMDARALNKLSMPELTKLAVNYNLEDISGLRKQELIGRIVAVQA